ncbi:MAG: sulfatase-like hydrolase/transferase [Rhodobacteraceae bacterium]|nr:sulfatase-like hydrolase/transferase [Paracoccaceae bacterium]
MSRPNFLFFMTDQQRRDWLGCYGHPVVKTPHIDAIANKGTRFDRFFVASPICMPNRASFMTGRMPSVHGLRYNGCFLPLGANTFVDVLRAGGYETAAFGKCHLQPMVNLPPVQEREENSNRLVQEAWKTTNDAIYQEETDPESCEGGTHIDTPYYGFDQVEVTTLHGDRLGGDYQHWFRSNIPDWENYYDPVNQLPHNYTCLQAYRTPVPEHLYPTSWIADRAITFLDKQGQSDSPFFAFVSFPDPHHPFNPPGKYWGMYSPDEFDVDLPFSAHKNPTPPMQWLLNNYHAGGGQLTRQTVSMVDDRSVREIKALTSGMVSCIDDAVGRVVKALKANGQYDNTVICFNSDHGDYLGDFNFVLKGLMPFKSITQIPMIWSDPESRKARVTEQLGSTIDLSATILERAGLQTYNGIQGKNLLPTIFDNQAVRNEIMVEFNDGASKLGFKQPARVRSLVDSRWRYTIYANQSWGELYDLYNNPDETQNLWDDPESLNIRHQLSERMNHQLTNFMDESPLSTRLA